ncbi:hypothetical protein L7F22_053532 [Adiantum nelumboides]|nr:hypothetical protein [Adiantum nelumboides]
MTTVHFLCALAAHFGWEVHQSDIVIAFLNGDIFEEVYAMQPRSFVKKGQEDKVCKCNKALYGLKQSPCAWYEKADTHLVKRGFCNSPIESTLYVKREGDVLLIVVLYVDELLITGPNKRHIAEFKADLNATFKMKDLGLSHHYLGAGNGAGTSDKTTNHQLLYLNYQFENEVDAKIYKDSMEQYFVKLEDRPSDERDVVPVVYSGDRYFDDQEFMYLVVQNLSIVDKWGMIGTKEKVDVEPEETPPALNKPNLKLIRINDMTRVNTDNTFLRLHKYDGEEHIIYYRCEEPLVNKLTDLKRLYVFSFEEMGKWSS